MYVLRAYINWTYTYIGVHVVIVLKLYCSQGKEKEQEYTHDKFLTTFFTLYWIS